MRKYQHGTNYYQPASVQDSLSRPPNKRGRRLFRIILVALCVGISVKALSLAATQLKLHGVVTSTATALANKPAPINQTQLAAQVNQAVAGSNLEVGVSMIDLSNNARYDYGLGDTEYLAASTTKLLSASLFLHDVEAGQASLGQTVGDSTAQTELQKMIVVSDDDAWVAFNDLLGHPALLQYAKSLGMNSYDPDNNLITSDDLALLLANLYHGKLLNSPHTKLLLSYMAQADYKQYIGGVIPGSVKFYHKIGYLDDRVMDAAIIDNGQHPYVLVIFTKDPSGSYDQTAGQQVFHEITNATLSAFAH
jgi:beta-lactamase class A